MNKWATIAGVVLIAGFCVLGFVELMQAQIPYVTKVADVKAASRKQLQFMGEIVQESIKFDSAQNMLDFHLRDPSGARLPVRYHGVKPANFDSAPRAVVVGEFVSPDFIAKQVMTSCPSKYKGK
jgi:cytochrome c-type biogenesis protein CcmE